MYNRGSAAISLLKLNAYYVFTNYLGAIQIMVKISELFPEYVRLADGLRTGAILSLSASDAQDLIEDGGAPEFMQKGLTYVLLDVQSIFGNERP